MKIPSFYVNFNVSDCSLKTETIILNIELDRGKSYLNEKEFRNFRVIKNFNKVVCLNSFQV